MAVVIFVSMFVLIVTDKIERQWVTLGCGLLTIIFVFGIGLHSFSAVKETLNLRNIFTTGFWYQAGEASESSSGINWATIIFIAGMMVMVEGMARAGFFRWLCMIIAKCVNFKPIAIFITFMFLSAFLAMFIDSITVILFLAAVTIELAQMLKFNPVPMILTEIFCANLGGSATMCGDPPNIIIGTSLGYSFSDFLTNTGLIAGISLIVVVIYFYITLHKKILIGHEPIDKSKLNLDPKSVITDKFGFICSCVIFACAVVMLVTHAETGLTVALIGVIIAALTLATSGRHCAELLKKVDYKTLLFFIGLFIVVGGLEQTGILEIIANFIAKISNGNIIIMIAIILWVSAIASAFVDNIPFAATMIPVIQSLAATQGVPLPVMAWTLALGTDIGGSATPIGASANVVGIAVASKEGYPISWGKYCKEVAPATALVMIISLICIYIRYF
jgi:Na+/H+ antiporter NhaD/arsenite permease-like protein